MHKPAAANIDPAELEAVYLFRALDDAQRAAMAKVTERMTLAPGRRLFNQGDEVRRFFLVESGCVKLYRLSADGDEKVIDLVAPGHTFAEAAMFMDRRTGYPVNAEAVELTRLLGFDAATFLSLLEESTASCLALLGVMARRLRFQVNEIDRLALQNATARFISYMLDPADSEIRDGKRIELPVPKNVLASRLSIQPETFSRILSRLSGAGLIRVEKQAIILLDVKGLRDQVMAPR